MVVHVPLRATTTSGAETSAIKIRDGNVVECTLSGLSALGAPIPQYRRQRELDVTNIDHRPALASHVRAPLTATESSSTGGVQRRCRLSHVAGSQWRTAALLSQDGAPE